jgi:hypothetical protein
MTAVVMRRRFVSKFARKSCEEECVRRSHDVAATHTIIAEDVRHANGRRKRRRYHPLEHVL